MMSWSEWLGFVGFGLQLFGAMIIFILFGVIVVACGERLFRK